MAPRFLHVGCDEPDLRRLPRFFHPPAWEEVRFDINPDARPDILGSMTDMSMIADGEFDALYSSHNVEHLYPHEVAQALKEFRRVLRPGGFAIIRCPDLQLMAERILATGLETPMYTSPAGPVAPIDALYGMRPRLAAGATYMAHRTGFTNRTLVDHLIRNGFANALVLRFHRNMELHAAGFASPTPAEAMLARLKEALAGI
jgi:SAM-dependent methyltransferase